MLDPERVRQFNTHYARNLAEATRLRGLVVVIFGVGAVGGFIASWLARHGVSLLIIDMDRVDSVNLMRFVLTERKWLGWFKAEALAQQLRSELPALQSIRSLVADARALTWQQLNDIFGQANLVIASTGNTVLDRVLDQWARFRGVPVLFPSLLAGHDTFLGDLHVVAWNLFAARRGACFSCQRPERPAEPPPAEAQQGAAIDVLRVAELTTDVALTLLLDGPERRALVRGLERGINYFVIPRWPPAPQRVLTFPRAGCPVCQPGVAATRATVGANDTPLPRDWLMVGALAVAIVLGELVPGGGYLVTLIAVGLVTLWWRDRLPSFDELAAALRRFFEGGS